jgi:lipopolysaccharide/colanic/teichoic acid biosynthesis glycosyltransferase
MLKRSFDIVASFFGLVLILPVLLIIALLIKLCMPGPVLFFQKRAGRNGRPFTIYKFRTMTVNHGGSTISVKGENRITSLGARLRKFKLDELPELWNILKGDMSFVGPRPDMPEYADRLTGEARKILELSPGLTGPASLKYANEEELMANINDPQKYNDEVIWPDKVRINLEYYWNRSFLGDILIILRTFFGSNSSKYHQPDDKIV